MSQEMRVFLILCSIFEVFGLLYLQRIRVSAHSFTAPLSLLRAGSLHHAPNTTRHAQNTHFEADIALYNALITCRDPELGSQINKSLSIIADALRLYGPENVVASYNGGKDADVVMSLMRAATAKFSFDHNLSSSSAVFIYFEVESEFPEVVTHIKNQEKLLGLRLVRSPKGIVQGISEYMENSKSGPLAFILGTRKGDPNCGEQQFFSPSSTWMPPFMRVNPILNWTYGQVWDLLRTFELNFCELYNEGYTSLGKTTDTLQNPELRRVSADGTTKYLPAYMLQDWTKERAGRRKNANPPLRDTKQSAETLVTSIESSDGCDLKNKPSNY